MVSEPFVSSDSSDDEALFLDTHVSSPIIAAVCTMEGSIDVGVPPSLPLSSMHTNIPAHNNADESQILPLVKGAN